jgi:hypothetical protein
MSPSRLPPLERLLTTNTASTGSAHGLCRLRFSDIKPYTEQEREEQKRRR